MIPQARRGQCEPWSKKGYARKPPGRPLVNPPGVSVRLPVKVSLGGGVTETEFATLRGTMVADITAHTIFLTGRLDKATLNRRVMDVLAKVPRHAFVHFELQPLAYADTPLPSGYGKTISQPFIVALMTDLLEVAANRAGRRGGSCCRRASTGTGARAAPDRALP